MPFVNSKINLNNYKKVINYNKFYIKVNTVQKELYSLKS